MNKQEHFSKQVQVQKKIDNILSQITNYVLNNKDLLFDLLFEILSQKSEDELVLIKEKMYPWGKNRNSKNTKFIVTNMMKDGEIPTVACWDRVGYDYPSKEAIDAIPCKNYDSNEDWVKENLERGFFITHVREIFTK